MSIAAWPVVGRHRVVHAFKPGGNPAAEGPFRTLREHRWASSGIRVSRHAGRRFAGQMTVFSSLNVESARLARHGDVGAAVRLAAIAAKLETGPEFAKLQRILSGLPSEVAERVVDGVLPAGAPSALADVLKAAARLTEQLRASEPPLAARAGVIAGRISEVHETYVVLVRVSGQPAMIPRWLAVSANRDIVGAPLALFTDKLDDLSAVVEAIPAIDTDDSGTGFTPFGRGDARVRALTAADEHLLAGYPTPLQILVPVLIDA